MLRHVGVCMSENGLRVFQSEFITDVVGVRVSHLVGNPAFYLCLITCSCDRTAERIPCDPEQLHLRIGRKILRQQQLRLWSKMQRSTLIMVNGLVIADIGLPDVASAINHSSREFQ